MMNRIKVEKNKDYTIISNVFLRDKSLSLKAKGVLAMVMAMKEDWDFTINGFCKITKEGEAAIYTAIKELKDNGYCKESKIRDENKRIIGNEYTFYEIQQTKVADNQLNCENQDLGFLNQENQGQLNTNNNKILNETKEIKEDKSSLKKEKDELFEKCWIAYNRKGSKKQAKVQWDKLDDVERNNVLPHIKAYVGSREKQYQKDFERYIKDRVFLSVVFKGNQIIYDPTKLGKGDSANNVYTPSGNFSLMWDEPSNAYMYIGYYYDGMEVADGYTKDNRPNGAKIILNNARGIIIWNSQTKKWEHDRN